MTTTHVFNGDHCGLCGCEWPGTDTPCTPPEMGEEFRVKHYHRINVFDNETEALVTEITLTNEQVEALRPYLAVGGDIDLIGEHEIGPNLSLFVGAYCDV